MTMELIQRVELAASQPSISLSSIPQGFTDLYLLTSLRSTGSATGAYFAFNGSTADFSGRFLQGSGSSVNSGTDARRAGYVTGSDTTANVFASNAILITNYTVAAPKSYFVDHVQESNAVTSYQGIFGGIWNQTAAINSITITNPTGDMAAGSSVSIYGIKNRTLAGGIKATGGSITSDGQFVYHTFTSSGTFAPTQTLNAQVLVVAGGGGSSYGDNGGGGGAGGYLEGSMTIAAGSYAVTIGAGGSGPFPGVGRGGQGSDSVFNGATALGGGIGGGGGNVNATSGGSGGGAGFNGSSYGTAGAGLQGNSGGLTGYGNAGQTNTTGTRGGGAGSSGSAGGAGRTWLNGITYARGGNVAGTTPGTVQPANSGNGGDQGSPGAAGIVIVRYAI